MRKLIVWLLVISVVLVTGLAIWSHRFGVPEDFADTEEQFKYGSIGSDHPLTRGIPYWIWKALPEMFPPQQILPEGFRPKNDKKG